MIVVQGFITAEERFEIAALAIELADKKLLPIPQGGTYKGGRPLKDVKKIPALVEVTRRVMERYADCEPDTGVGHFIMLHPSGVSTPLHRDLALPGKRHLRCNILIQNPVYGGEVIIAEVKHFIPERAIWEFCANLSFHGSVAVSGPRHRILLSYGFQQKEADQ